MGEFDISISTRKPHSTKKKEQNVTRSQNYLPSKSMLSNILDLFPGNLLRIIAYHDPTIVVVAPTGPCLLVDRFLRSSLRQRSVVPYTVLPATLTNSTIGNQ